MGIDPLLGLGTFATIIALGFLGHLLFERTRVTDAILLMAFGLIVGPWLGIFDVQGFRDASPLVGALALIVIMFDSGLGMDIRALVNGLARGVSMAVLGFILSVGGIALVGHELLGLDWARAALLGTILGGTCSVIAGPILSGASVHPTTRSLSSVESAFTDVLCVIGAFTVMGLLSASEVHLTTAEATVALQRVAAQFSVAIVAGVVVGLVWLRILKALGGRRYSYMLTLAAVLSLYVGVEFIGGNGAIAALLFGLVLGNGRLIARKLDIEGMQFSENQRVFQGEVAFLVRVFAFVYIGVILDPRIVVDPVFLTAGGALLAVILLARVTSVIAATLGKAETRGDRAFLALLVPRGLAAIVLAGLPAQMGIAGTGLFLSYAFIVVAVTNAVATLAVLSHERAIKRAAHRTPVADSLAQAGGVFAAFRR